MTDERPPPPEEPTAPVEPPGSEPPAPEPAPPPAPGGAADARAADPGPATGDAPEGTDAPARAGEPAPVEPQEPGAGEDADAPPDDGPPEVEPPPDAPDPRMRDRWVEARRQEGRRRLVVLGAIFGVVALGALAYLVARSSLFGVDHVEVEGARATSAADIRRAAGIDAGEPVLFVDEGAVAARVERLPFVARARVDAQFPDTVVITVTERAPVAWVRLPEVPRVALVAADGRVLARVRSVPDGLPRVDGTAAPGAVGSRVADPTPFRALGRFPEGLRFATRVLRMQDDEAVAALRGDPPTARQIRFGPLTDVRAKAAAAMGVIAELDRSGERVVYVDVRVPDSPATR